LTKVKINGTPSTHALDALMPHVPSLYANLGKRVVAIVELAAVDRLQVAPEEDKEASVTLQVKHAEVAGPDQEEAVRLALRALHIQRTAYGTITEQGDIEIAERTLAACAGELAAIEAARLHIAVERYAELARTLQLNGKLTISDLRRELKLLADGLSATIHPDVLMPAG
jgi:hypothetical protein